MKSDQSLEQVLLYMDAAEQSSQPYPARAQVDLNLILSSQPLSTASNSRWGASHESYKPTRRRRAVALGGLAAAATAALLVLPALTGAGDPAFATWTAAPGTLIGPDRDNAVSD